MQRSTFQLNRQRPIMPQNLGANGEPCDVNKDGAVNVADISTIIDKMASQARMQEETTE